MASSAAGVQGPSWVAGPLAVAWSRGDHPFASPRIRAGRNKVSASSSAADGVSWVTSAEVVTTLSANRGTCSDRKSRTTHTRRRDSRELLPGQDPERRCGGCLFLPKRRRGAAGPAPCVHPAAEPSAWSAQSSFKAFRRPRHEWQHPRARRTEDPNIIGSIRTSRRDPIRRQIPASLNPQSFIQSHFACPFLRESGHNMSPLGAGNPTRPSHATRRYS